ncbi:tetratricopeptide (TPR) repeat protein [Streptomyces canus]|uniref:tetratricopeptide repeat protein n=1 Tax=Streptomyces canus TaxID=58343 RepID=UPI00278AC520|nr:tetratricopeptide repeat protein [Streptomyces canus]MDQ0598651.1 tetratricopeptide (TPR) repeat protein [Streptomyces canus]
MGEITDFDTLRRAMAENGEQPEGPARNARAEQLLVAAEKLNVPLAVIEALGHQLKVYNYSSEKDKMFVPFARLLRMWDERPEDFDEYETHTLHWVFKWVSSGMLDQPHVPLASIEKWLGEMEHRYRLAGHSERAVRSAEFNVAAHIGDLPRAERAYAAWLAADRDRMADCPACELHGQGWWQSERSRDAEALELWTPVLEGELSCAHEPHTSLAASLLPLLRLGRLDEARANHLRGFRLVRAMESMRGAYADHVEFCALSGNEARGLELLAERPAYFTDTGHPRSGLEFLSVVALLMDRLTGLGLGDRQVPGPAGRSWTARELATHARAEALDLAGRFDARNGTAHVSERARARMAQEPLVERLPLGVRSARTAAPPTASPAVAPEAAEPDPAALIAEARRLSDGLRPNAVEAWVAVSRAAQGVELDPRDRAEIADHQAMDLGPEGVELFERAAELYTEAGDPGEALAARARGAFVRTLAGDTDAALTAIAGPYDEILALYAEDGTGVRQTASVLMARARILMRRVQEAGEAPEGGERADAAGASPVGEAPAGEGAPTSAETPADHPVTDGLPPGEALGGVARQGETPDDGSTDGGIADGDLTAARALDGAATAAAGSHGDPTTAEAPNNTPAAPTTPGGNPTTTGGSDGNPTPTAAPGGSPTAAGVPGRRPSMASLRADADAAVREVLALVDGRAGDDVQLGSRAAEAWAMFAELAVGAGELRTGADLFRHAAEGFVGAGLPWFAVESEARLAQLAHHMGDVAEAERALRAALEHGGPYLEAVGRAQLHLQLAEVLGGRGMVEEAAEHALEAAHWADGAGEGPALGAWARQLLGGFLLRQGRWAEAAEVLESALPDLAPETHGDGAVVQVQWWLGDCLSELGEHRAAAERRLQAAEIAKLWPEQQDHATLAHLAAESLGRAGLSAEADRAYARAGELWRSIGDVHGLVRALRARAWLALDTEDGQGEAKELMADAVRECEEALGADAADEEARQRLVAELGHTHRQFGDLLARSAAEDDDDDSIRAAMEDALSQVTEAIVVFAALGDDALHSRTGAELAAGWLEADLGRPDRAATRARAVLAAYQAYEAYEESDADETVPARRAEARQMLDVLED